MRIQGKIRSGHVRVRIRLVRHLGVPSRHTVVALLLDHRPPTIIRYEINEPTWTPVEIVLVRHGRPEGMAWMLTEAGSASVEQQGDIRGVFTAPLPNYIGVSPHGYYQCEDTLGKWFDSMVLTTVFHYDPETDTYVEMEP